MHWVLMGVFVRPLCALGQWPYGAVGHHGSGWRHRELRQRVIAEQGEGITLPLCGLSGAITHTADCQLPSGN